MSDQNHFESISDVNLETISGGQSTNASCPPPPPAVSCFAFCGNTTNKTENTTITNSGPGASSTRIDVSPKVTVPMPGAPE